MTIKLKMKREIFEALKEAIAGVEIIEGEKEKQVRQDTPIFPEWEEIGAKVGKTEFLSEVRNGKKMRGTVKPLFYGVGPYQGLCVEFYWERKSFRSGVINASGEKELREQVWERARRYGFTAEQGEYLIENLNLNCVEEGRRREKRLFLMKGQLTF